MDAGSVSIKNFVCLKVIMVLVVLTTIMNRSVLAPVADATISHIYGMITLLVLLVIDTFTSKPGLKNVNTHDRLVYVIIGRAEIVGRVETFTIGQDLHDLRPYLVFSVLAIVGAAVFAETMPVHCNVLVTDRGGPTSNSTKVSVTDAYRGERATISREENDYVIAWSNGVPLTTSDAFSKSKVLDGIITRFSVQSAISHTILLMYLLRVFCQITLRPKRHSPIFYSTSKIYCYAISSHTFR